MRYIDADKLIELSTITRTYKGDSCITVDDIDDCPTEDVAPIIHAYWKDECCTNCGTSKFVMKAVRGFDEVIYEYEGEANYCPNCGAKMDGKENDT